jgi:hypothetical protein
MAQAKMRVSTPPTNTSKTKVKKVAETSVAETAEQRNLRLAEAFRELEQPMREVWCLGEIAADAAMGIPGEDEIEVLHFSVCRLCEAIRDLRANYVADLHAGMEVT